MDILLPTLNIERGVRTFFSNRLHICSDHICSTKFELLRQRSILDSKVRSENDITCWTGVGGEMRRWLFPHTNEVLWHFLADYLSDVNDRHWIWISNGFWMASLTGCFRERVTRNLHECNNCSKVIMFRLSNFQTKCKHFSILLNILMRDTLFQS